MKKNLSLIAIIVFTALASAAFTAVAARGIDSNDADTLPLAPNKEAVTIRSEKLLYGKVTRQDSGEFLKGADVVLYFKDSKWTKRALTDENGQYAFLSLTSSDPIDLNNIDFIYVIWAPSRPAKKGGNPIYGPIFYYPEATVGGELNFELPLHR